MKQLTILTLALVVIGHALCDAIDTRNFREEIREALKKIMATINENKMNVTLITSEISTWADGEVKEVNEYSILLPTNNIQPTKSEITEQTVQDWINTFNNSIFTGRSRTVHIKDGKTEKIDTATTRDDKWFETRLYKTVTSVKDGQVNFAVENPSYQNYYHIYIPEAGGKDKKSGRIELVVGHIEVLTVFGLGNNVLINLPELDKEQLNWPQQKIQTIEYLLDTLIEVGNVTLIGWQQIWNSDGSLKEIRTIELTLLNQTLVGDILELSDDDIGEELPVVLDVMDSLTSAAGILVTGSIEQLDRHDNIQISLEMSPDAIVAKFIDSDLLYWQQNITVSSPAPVQNLIKTLQQQSRLPVGVLQMNVDGTLNLQSSVIVPELLATISAADNVTLPMLESALMGVVKGVLLQPDTVATYTANYMKQNIPGFVWVTGEDIVASSTLSDVHLSVEYGWVDIGQVPPTIDIMGIPTQAL